jgi:hypothetical protein
MHLDLLATRVGLLDCPFLLAARHDVGCALLHPVELARRQRARLDRPDLDLVGADIVGNLVLRTPAKITATISVAV